MPTKLSVGECLKFGWESFKKKPLMFVAAIIILGVIQSIVSALQEGLGNEGMGGLAGFLIALIVSTLLYCGTLNFFLHAHDDVNTAKLSDLWHPKPFLQYLIASILATIIVAIGLVLLIVPGIILMLVLFFTGYLVVDKGMSAVAALKESRRLTRGNRWKLFLLVLSIVGLSILGAIPLFLGLLIVAPVAALASVHAYRVLSGAPAPMPAPAAGETAA